MDSRGTDEGDRFWAAARTRLDGLPGGGLNIAHEAVTRHARGALGSRVALVSVGREGERRLLTYRQLDRLSSRFANLLRGLGVGPGETVFSLMGRLPELYVAAIGTLKARSVFSPLFAAFGPQPVRTRLEIADARVLVTTARLYERKVAEIVDALPRLRHVLVVGQPETTSSRRVRSLTRLLAKAEAEFTIEPTDPEEAALLHFTSGTTGRPKAAVHVHEAIVAHHATARWALGLAPGDVYWCTADPGWVTGTSYGITGPLAVGASLVSDREEFDAEQWCHILETEGVEVWYTAPTALRMLARLGVEPARRADLSRLRHVASVGEPLDAATVRWSATALGVPAHDTWWQTETGSIMIANPPGSPPRPGSMGRPVPGVEAALLAPEGGRIETDGGVEMGELALKTPWPSLFRGYLGDEERYRRRFERGWYRTGDLVRRDADGYFWFVGRADDMIQSAGHLIGPFEVESALLEHPAVAEVGVVGAPDPVVGEIVKAFVTLRHGAAAGEEQRRDLMAHARRRLGPAVAPRRIEFVEALPKTRSGKVVRRLLRTREPGHAEEEATVPGEPER